MRVPQVDVGGEPAGGGHDPSAAAASSTAPYSPLPMRCRGVPAVTSQTTISPSSVAVASRPGPMKTTSGLSTSRFSSRGSVSV